MSLDVTLYGEEITEKCWCDKCDNEHIHTYRPALYDANITHNLGKMAKEAGIYEALWHPEELEITTADQLTPILAIGLARLLGDPKKFKKFDSPNGWGVYDDFVPWVGKYLNACKTFPNAIVKVSI